jgi:short-subunit dehydrogenase
MAREFAAMGRDLALCARRLEPLQDLREELLAINSDIRVEVRRLDVNDHEQVFAVFREFQQIFGQLDRVIVNAGIGKGAPIGKGGFRHNLATAQTNFCAALAQCEAAVEIFREQNAGHLVTVSSMSAWRGLKGAISTFAATKAGLANLSEGIRIELMKTPIKVTTLFPGYILTDINRDAKNAPFRVDEKTGCRALVKAIEAEPAEACVPRWPWAGMKAMMKAAPLSALAKM